MKKAILTLFAIGLCCSFAGNITASAKEDEGKAQEKAEKKQLKEMQDSLDFVEALNILESMDFVIKANQLIFKTGTNPNPDGNTNFLSVQYDKSILQLTSNEGISGPNGIGGITLEGSVSSLKKNIDKKGNFYMVFDLIGTAISARVNIKLPNGSKIVNVNIAPTFNADNFIMYGNVYEYDKADIFQGRTL